MLAFRQRREALALLMGPQCVVLLQVAERGLRSALRVRGRGIGTSLLEGLIAESEESDRKLSIHVESNNPARSLYERLGFAPVGENGVYLLMERPPR